MLSNHGSTRIILTCLFLFFIVKISAQNIRLDIPNTPKEYFSHFDPDINKYTIVDSTERAVCPLQFDRVTFFDKFYSKNLFFDAEDKCYKGYKYFYKTYLEESIIFLQTHALVVVGEREGFVDLKTGELLMPDIKIDWIEVVCLMSTLNDNDGNSWIIDRFFVYGGFQNKFKMIVLSNENSPLLISYLYYQFENSFSFSEITRESPFDPEPYFVFTSSNQSYNVNVFDKFGKWYETGLLIEANDKVYIKLTEGKFELTKSRDEKYKYEIQEKELYVK